VHRAHGLRCRAELAVGPADHAIHIAAVTQIRHHHSPCRAFYDRKLTEGKTKKKAIRALKRRISDALYTRMRHEARQAAEAANTGPDSSHELVLQAKFGGPVDRPRLRPLGSGPGLGGSGFWSGGGGLTAPGRADAAVDDERVAGDVRGVGAREPEGRIGDLLG
jgi:hypothetical protein